MNDLKPPTRISPRDRDAILNSLRGGVVPARGLQHVQVGRAREIDALVGDIDRVADGGSAVRFIIGRYGAGKTFFLHLVRTIALQRRFVTVHADLTPDRRLQASGGQARALYAELMSNAATRAKPEGGAMPAIIERFVTSAQEQASQAGTPVLATLQDRLASLSELPGGYDVATVVEAYWRAFEHDDDIARAHAVRWFRGEFSTKTEARQALGVRSIVDDSNMYERLKLFARFVSLAGFSGLLVSLDEMVNLHRIGHAQARRANYEQVLHIVNDGLQGGAERLAVIMSGTPEFLTDPRRGLYSYEALESRLAENSFATEGRRDVTGPVIRLENLAPEDLYVLLTRLVTVYHAGSDRTLIDEAGIRAFMEHCQGVIGAEYFQTPRNVIKSFIDLLAVLDQNEDTRWDQLLPRIAAHDLRDAPDEPLEGEDVDDELATFSL